MYRMRIKRNLGRFMRALLRDLVWRLCNALAKRVSEGLAGKIVTFWYLYAELASRLWRYEFADYDPIRDGFSRICIEVNGGCNYSCVFCPVRRIKRPNTLMDFSLYKKIINELAELGYKGSLGFDLFNEPLLNDELPKYVKYARTKLGKAVTIDIFTNGSLLTEGKIKELLEAGVDLFIVNDYTPGLIAERIKDMNLSDEQRKHFSVRVLDRRPWPMGPLAFSNRVGEVPEAGYPLSVKMALEKHGLPLNTFCHEPFSKLIVNFRGEVQLCCEDAVGHEIIGNVREHSLMKLWSSDKMRDFREALMRCRRIGICRRCNRI